MCGLLGLYLKRGRLRKGCETLLFFLDLPRFGKSAVLCIGLWRCVILGLRRGGVLPLSFFSSTSFGLGSVLSVRRTFPDSVGTAGQHRYLEVVQVLGLCSEFIARFGFDLV